MTDQSAPRVPPLERDQWPAHYAALLDATVPQTNGMEAGSTSGGQRPVGMLRVLANHSQVMEPFITWSTFVAHGALGRREHELAALRAIWLLRSEFEYGHHVAYARGAGLSEEEIEGVRVGPSWPHWNELDRALVSAADELLDTSKISDATWAVFERELTLDQRIEVPITVGQYTMLSFVAESLGVELEDGYERLPTP
ncbi:MAG: carboxymuconolactone decarboxylase family protein [Acidimicrobiales bacterium]|nr:carboxymuconolactone decarboxylase family protein [Acidimicrobiales bacterium]